MAPISLALRRQPLAAHPTPPAAQHGELAAQIGREVAQALSAAMERVEALQATGRIDRAGLAALRQDIERARRVGMIGQQLDRLAGGQLPLSPEPMNLGVMLKEAVDQRQPDFTARGLALAARLRPVAVIGDSTLTFSLLQALLDWCLEHTRGPVEVQLALKTWPETAFITCSFPCCGADEPPHAEALDTMSWRLLHQTAGTLGLPLHRTVDEAGKAALVVDFPRTLSAGGTAPTGPRPVDDTPRHARRLAPGTHVLVLAPRREVRNAVREALRPHALMIDFVTSVDEARSFCRGARPQALVYEAALGGESLERLRAELAGQPPAPAYVQISEDGKGFELRRQGAREIATVPRTTLADALPVALRFEIGRVQSYPV